MRAVWKFPLGVGEFTLNLPDSAYLTHVGDDGSGLPHLWAEVDTNTIRSGAQRFYLARTGEQIPDWATYHVGTFTAPGTGIAPHGVFVGHLFHEGSPA